MQDQPMVRVLQIFLGRDLLERDFDVERVLAGRKARSV
jgi:hypothetical protein